MNVPSYALDAIARLNAAGFDAWLVGGCVRDSLMGRVPEDYDVTTSAPPEQTEAVFAGERLIETGLKHGTVTVLLDGSPLEITTYRRDGGYSDHRHPDEVLFTPRLEDDLARRDFTVNAMAWNPTDGLVDCFGGQKDLADGIIRCVGDPERRFDEDALRILRALRFSSVLGFALEPETLRAARAKKDSLSLVSRERIAAELVKLLCGLDVVRVLTTCWDILAVPLPELAAMAGFDQHSRYHCYDVLTHCAVAVGAVPPEPALRLAALFHDAGKPACFTRDPDGAGHFYGHAKVSARLAQDALTRLRFDRETVTRVTTLVGLHDVPLEFPGAERDRAVKRQLRRLGEEDFFRLLDLKRADALAHAPQYRSRTLTCDRAAETARRILAEQQCFSLKDLAVNGTDLIAAGVPEGPAIGRLLNNLLEAVIAGEAANEKQALLSRAADLAAAVRTAEKTTD